jgi:hypothetical protein
VRAPEELDGLADLAKFVRGQPRVTIGESAGPLDEALDHVGRPAFGVRQSQAFGERGDHRVAQFGRRIAHLLEEAARGSW